MRPGILISTIGIFVAGCANHQVAPVNNGTSNTEPAPLLYVWAGDLDQRPDDTDFLAVIDSDPGSASYGEVIATEPVGVVGTNPHHTELSVPENATFFANGYAAGRTFLFDLSTPEAPILSGELAPVSGFAYPHSFVRLDDGEVIATMQYGDGSVSGNPGGLARFDSESNLVSVTSAADPEFEGE